MAKEKAEQFIMEGMVTEQDIFRKMMREIGSRGGSRKTVAQTEARRTNIAKAIAKRAENRLKK